MNRQEQFGAFIAAAQEKGESNITAETMGDLVARILSKRNANRSGVSAGNRQRTSPRPYAGKPKCSSGRQSS
jgi:hypothetical protein